VGDLAFYTLYKFDVGSKQGCGPGDPINLDSVQHAVLSGAYILFRGELKCWSLTYRFLQLAKTNSR
jgi:hypothetical protein